MSAEPLRVFVAVEPSEDARAEVGVVQRRLAEELRPAGWNVSFPQPANLHLTLRFLGDLHRAKVDEVGRSLSGLAGSAAFEIAFDTLGAFPTVRKPRVLWIAPTRGANALKALASRADGILNGAGIPPEDREWAPHLTLARVRRASGSARRVLETVSPDREIASQVAEVVLFSSELHRGGTRYEALYRVPLTG